MNRSTAFVAGATLLMWGPIAFAQQRLDTLALEKTFLEEVQAMRAPGASIAIVVGNDVAFAKGVGSASVETSIPVTPETLFRLGSTTKMFTGLTAVLLGREGKLALDRPIGAYATGLHQSLRNTTLRQLLSHSGGLMNEAAGDGPHDDAALGRRVRTWTAAYRFAPAGDIYSYSGPGYWLAGYAIEQAAGGWYADVVKQRVLAPLGMVRSTFRPLEAMTYPLALDHRVTNGVAAVLRPFSDDVTTWPSGSLFSSASELARFAIAMVNEGRVDGKQILASEAVRAMYQAQASVPGGDCSYTFGLSSCPGAKGRRFSHYGFRVGSGSVITLIPEARVAVIILSNRNGGIFGRTEAKALELLGVGEREPSDDVPLRAFTAMERRQFAARWVNGRDTLYFETGGDTLVYRYGTARYAVRARSPGELIVLENGEPSQRFVLVTRPGGVYLHDGLSAFRRR